MSNTSTRDKIIQEVRLFFKNISWKKCLTFLVFLLLSTIFWVMQIYREKFEATYAIPIKYTHVPDSIMFEDDLPLTFNASIKDDGASLFRYYLTKRNDSLEINIRELIHSKKGSMRLNIPGESVALLIREKLFGGTELISYSPSFVASPYVVMQQKTVPVVYKGKIELRDGYIIDGDITTIPREVQVYSSKQSLDTILRAYTAVDTLRNLDKNLTLPIALVHDKGVRFIPDSIYLNIPIDQLNVRDVNIPIECKNLPQGLSVKFFPATVKVTFTVGLKKYQEASPDKFNIVVDYNDILKLKSSSISLQLTNKPDYVRIQSIDPGMVEFILEKD